MSMLFADLGMRMFLSKGSREFLEKVVFCVFGLDTFMLPVDLSSFKIIMLIILAKIVFFFCVWKFRPRTAVHEYTCMHISWYLSWKLLEIAVTLTVYKLHRNELNYVIWFHHSGCIHVHTKRMWILILLINERKNVAKLFIGRRWLMIELMMERVCIAKCDWYM